MRPWCSNGNSKEKLKYKMLSLYHLKMVQWKRCQFISQTSVSKINVVIDVLNINTTFSKPKNYDCSIFMRNRLIWCQWHYELIFLFWHLIRPKISLSKVIWSDRMQFRCQNFHIWKGGNDCFGCLWRAKEIR